MTNRISSFGSACEKENKFHIFTLMVPGAALDFNSRRRSSGIRKSTGTVGLLAVWLPGFNLWFLLYNGDGL